MTQLDAQTSTEKAPYPSRPIRYADLAARALLAVVFLGAGVSKVTGDAAMQAMFDDLGGGASLRLFVGCAEIAGAIGLFVPRVRRFAAIGLTLLMVGATVASISVLNDSPLLPAALALIAGGVARVAFAARRSHV